MVSYLKIYSGNILKVATKQEINLLRNTYPMIAAEAAKMPQYARLPNSLAGSITQPGTQVSYGSEALS